MCGVLWIAALDSAGSKRCCARVERARARRSQLGGRVAERRPRVTCHRRSLVASPHGRRSPARGRDPSGHTAASGAGPNLPMAASTEVLPAGLPDPPRARWEGRRHKRADKSEKAGATRSHALYRRLLPAARRPPAKNCRFACKLERRKSDPARGALPSQMAGGGAASGWLAQPGAAQRRAERDAAVGQGDEADAAALGAVDEPASVAGAAGPEAVAGRLGAAPQH